jgi:hypothetical protein
LDELAITNEQLGRISVRVTPSVILKQDRLFAQVPLASLRKLEGASGNTVILWVWLCHKDWQAKHKPFVLPNGRLECLGVGRHSKWRSLNDLEKRGMIAVERRPRRSPLVHILAFSAVQP